MRFFKPKRGPAKALDLRSVKAPRLVHYRLIAGLLSLVAILAAAYWLVYRPGTPPAERSQMESAVAKVDKLMLLPKNEEPTFGVVADQDKVKNQTFFKNAENGDQVLIYEQAKLSILYRPSINKIINVGPLVVGSDGSPYVTSRFAIRNGTPAAELGPKMAARIKQAYPNATIVSTENASRAYPTSIAIDLTKQNQPLAEQVADSLKIQSGKQPLGEPLPDADFLIIIGQDYR